MRSLLCWSEKGEKLTDETTSLCAAPHISWTVHAALTCRNFVIITSLRVRNSNLHATSNSLLLLFSLHCGFLQPFLCILYLMPWLQSSRPCLFFLPCGVEKTFNSHLQNKEKFALRTRVEKLREDVARSGFIALTYCVGRSNFPLSIHQRNAMRNIPFV